MRVPVGSMARALPFQAMAHLTAIALLPLAAALAPFDRTGNPLEPAATPVALDLDAPPRRAGTGRYGATFAFDTPLFDRRLSAAEKAADLAPSFASSRSTIRRVSKGRVRRRP